MVAETSGERKQSLQQQEPWDRGEALARALTSSLREELDAVRSAAEMARIKQTQALDRERDRADTLARELDKMRIVGVEAVQAIEAEIRQRQAFEQERGRADALERELTSLRAELDAARIVPPEAAQAAEAEINQRQAREQALKQERDRADTLARELTSLRAEFDAARTAGVDAAQATDAKIKQRQALEQTLKEERDRAGALARELTSLRAELDTARAASVDAAQAADAKIKQRQALEQTLKEERNRADTLARELTSLRAEFDAARTAAPEASQAAEAEIMQRQALEQTLKQERDRADTLARERTSLRAELDTARAAGVDAAQAAAAAKVEQKQALDRERDKAETLARELASARKGVEERSALLAAAYAEVLRATETNSAVAGQQQQALASERSRADGLARELASVRNELEAGNRQIAAFNAPRAPQSSDLAANGSQESKIGSPQRATVGSGRSPERISGEAVASSSERSPAPELPRPEAQVTARDGAPGLKPKVATGTEQSTSASAASHFLPDEQRLLARASALLRQADISGARSLLEHAVERGSARAAFMLAETYDARVLQSWGARGISGDLPKARELYARAQAGGIEDAKGRIERSK
ncbi:MULTISPECIES: hypothetical protein [Bradyrhizobium]|uniref:hypothetical protein n=1 Tax=Bradyrhizobium TaxID=374 RepID=UPI000943CF3C|nr:MULTISPECIES: hypothetical protein [Bradyrhizobium]